MIKVLALLLVLLFSTPAFPADVTFVWDPNTESDLAGYTLYQGTLHNGPYVPVSGVLAGIETLTLYNVPDGEHYWVLTAYDTEGLESDYSNEVSAVIENGEFITQEHNTGCFIGELLWIGLQPLRMLLLLP